MTMGVGMLLDDAILLWADGRQAKLNDPKAIGTDDDDKIIILGPQLALMTSGVKMLCENVVSKIRLNYHLGISLHELIDLVESCLTNSWGCFTVAQDFHMTHPGVNCGLLFAGVAAGQPFVLLSQQGYRRPVPPRFTTMREKVLVSCSDTEQGHLAFDEASRLHLAGPALTGSYDDYLEAVVRTGAAAIRLFAEHDDYVGGTIRCAISKYNGPFEKRIVHGI